MLHELRQEAYKLLSGDGSIHVWLEVKKKLTPAELERRDSWDKAEYWCRRVKLCLDKSGYFLTDLSKEVVNDVEIFQQVDEAIIAELQALRGEYSNPYQHIEPCIWKVLENLHDGDIKGLVGDDYIANLIERCKGDK